MGSKFRFDSLIIEVKGTVGIQQNWRVICQDNGFSHELLEVHCGNVAVYSYSVTLAERSASCRPIQSI